MSRQYELILSTLEGIFGAEVGNSDEQAQAQLRSDLKHAPFREGLIIELSAAFDDPTISWRKILDDCKVASMDTEAEAINLVKELLKDAFSSSN
jgi:hypothetical protein